MAESVGEKIRARRLQLGLKLESLASAVGSSKAYIWQLENKRVARPSAALLLKIADALSISPDFLVDDSAVEPSDDQAANALFRKVQNDRLSAEDIKILMDISEGLSKKNQ